MRNTLVSAVVVVATIWLLLCMVTLASPTNIQSSASFNQPARGSSSQNVFAPGTIASWVQAIIYVITVGVLVWQASLLRRQIALQADAIRQSDYLRCQSDFTESIRILLRNSLHAEVYDVLATKGQVPFVGWNSYAVNDKKAYAYFELLYELLERVSVLHDEGVIPASHWIQWSKWMDEISGYQLAADVYRDNVGMFDPAFEAVMRDRFIAHGQTV